MPNSSTRLLCLLLFSCYCMAGMAQNLVPNSDFSESDSLGLRNWQRMENDSLYLYERNGKTDSAVYMVTEVQGKIPNSTTYFGWGENIIGVKLKEPLKPQTFYRLSLKIKHADSSRLMIDRFGIYFLHKDEPDVLLDLSAVNDSDEWLTLEHLYFAKGGECYLYLGKMADKGIVSFWNDRFKRKKYQSQWHLNEAGYRHTAAYLLDDVVLEKAPLQPSFITGKKFSPDDVLFETASAELSDRAKSYLMLLASFLRTHEEVLIAVEGFADERGKSEFNTKLSKARAVGVAEYFLRQGVARNRIKVEWFGSAGAGSNAQQYHLDRKVQFELVKR